MDLFICTTPLQSFIVKRIIEIEKLESKCIEVFFECKSNNVLKCKPFFLELSCISNNSTLHCDDLSFVQYYMYYREKFKGKRYNKIYLSSIDSVHFHFILSFVSFNKLITFDDGTANIIDGSIYRRKKEVGFFKKMLYSLSGNKFTMQKVIEYIDFHYTIYPGFENIHKNIVPITIFNFNEIKSDNCEKSCHVILGTVFREVALPTCASEYIENRVKDFIDSLKVSNLDVYYIPHPRQVSFFDADVYTLDNSFLAEQHIANLLKSHKEINLYGFASSAQFNVISATQRVKNHVLFSREIKPIFMELEGMLIDSGAKKIDID